MDILIAEDDNSARSLLSTYLKRWGHHVIEVADGEQAWQYLQHHPVHFVISDWLMPRVDGLELCRLIRAANFQHYTYIILLTAKNGKDEIIHGMESGADDFVTKPFNASELNARIRAGERIINLEKKLEDRNSRLSAANAIIRKDLEAAAELQKSLLPDATASLNGLTFQSLFLPCTYVAGDIFNFFQLDDRHIGFYLLDVAGHGIPAAMLSVTLSKMLATNVLDLNGFKNGNEYETLLSPARRVGELNKQFHSNDDSMRHFTMLYGMVDTQRNTVKVTQAGHPPPIVMNARVVAPLPTNGGFPVGLLPEMDYEEMEFDFNPGDRLIVYSDGVTECRNPKDEQYSLKRLIRRLQGLKNRPLPDVLNRLKFSLNSWRGRPDFDDDISVLAIERADIK